MPAARNGRAARTVGRRSGAIGASAAGTRGGSTCRSRSATGSVRLCSARRRADGGRRLDHGVLLQARVRGARRTPGRTEIVTDLDNFPTDRYVLEGVAGARGLRLVWLDGDPETVALWSARRRRWSRSRTSPTGPLASPTWRTSTRSWIDAGALMLWDLSHSAGSVPLSLDGDHAPLAVGCTYKYLNGGPGAPAYMYVRDELRRELRQPIWGWLGRRDPFEMAHGYEVADGMRGFLSGTPPVLALAAVDEGVKVVAEAGIDAIRAKGIALTELAIAPGGRRLPGVRVASPRDAGAARRPRGARAPGRAEPLCGPDRARRDPRLPAPRRDPVRVLAADDAVRRRLGRGRRAAGSAR